MGELNVGEAIEFLRDLSGRARWHEVKAFASSRVERLERLRGSKCPVLYIGSTGNLRARCRDLAGKRHTVFLALLALLTTGAEIDYGYKTTPLRSEAESLERELKERYRRLHGANPPLVEI
jgi:hypothetical protein